MVGRNWAGGFGGSLGLPGQRRVASAQFGVYNGLSACPQGLMRDARISSPRHQQAASLRWGWLRRAAPCRVLRPVRISVLNPWDLFRARDLVPRIRWLARRCT